MAASLGKTTSNSIGIPGREEQALKVQEQYDLSTIASPKLSPTSITSLVDVEKLGVPLKTPWTFWYDRCVNDNFFILFSLRVRHFHIPILAFSQLEFGIQCNS